MNKFIVSYYLKEILQRIYYYIWSFFLNFFVLYYFSYEWLYILITPYKRNFIFTESSELFTEIIFLNILFAFFISSPYCFYQIYTFLVPLWKKSEKKKYSLYFLIGGFQYLFFLLLFFMIYIQIFDFFLEQSVETFLYTIVSEIRIHSLLQNIRYIVFFPIPFLFFFSFSHYLPRKYAWIGVVIFASFFLPPDPLTQFYATLFLLFFYEVGLFVGLLKKRIF